MERSDCTQDIDRMDAWWDYPTMIITLDAKRRLTIPVALMKAAPGDHFQAVFDPEEDTVTFHRLPGKADWLEVLKACPVPMDDLPARRREFFRNKL